MDEQSGHRRAWWSTHHLSRKHRLLAVGAAFGVIVTTAAVGAVGISAAIADPTPEHTDTAKPVAMAAPVDVASLVVLIQKVEPLVRLVPLKDEASRLSAKGNDLWEMSELGSYDVPQAAMNAYKRAVATMERIRPACNLPWTVLAGVGRVESDHGRYGGSVLGSDGVPRPAIIGVALDGHGPFAAIGDSDNGRFDGDKVWDRAVGPMQFIPGTWASSGRDGDGDGEANPNDIDDAALAAAGYLCPSSGSLSSTEALRGAVYRYNASDYYVDLVLAFAHGYETGSFTIPSPPPPTSEGKAKDGESSHKGGKSKGSPTHTSVTHHGSTTPTQPGGTGSPSTDPVPTPTPNPDPTPPPPAEASHHGRWETCSGGWCVDGLELDLGGAGHQATAASADFDGDGSVETNAEEFAGLEGTEVEVLVREGGGPVLVLEIGGKRYRNGDGSFA